MGNIEQFGYKITKIQELSFLNLLSIKQSLNINEYIYFITKINNKTVNENINKLKQETKIIKEITLYNILTKKIYIIKDNIESEMFFNGIEIVYEKIPVIENVIRICNIFENSNANTLGLSSSNGYLIISTKNNYINCMDRLALEIKELNPCYFCFRSEWLWGHIDKLTTDNAQGEYYLTDLLQMAIDNHEKISSIAIDPMEAIGVNTKDDLEVAQKLLK